MPLDKSAVAIALDIARKHRANGGALGQADWLERTQAHLMTNKAASMPKFMGSTPGRVDKVVTPLAIKGNPATVTPLGQALSSMPKASNPPKPQFPKLPQAPQNIKLPKVAMKSGGEVETRTEPTSHGPLLGSTPGRADKINTKVEDGSYIIPADIPSSSALGEGNSLAGHAKLLKMFPNSGGQPSKSSKSEKGGSVDCCLSDGEFRVSRADCLKLGNGDLAKAHRILDHLVMRLRHHNIESLRTLPPPADSND